MIIRRVINQRNNLEKLYRCSSFMCITQNPRNHSLPSPKVLLNHHDKISANHSHQLVRFKYDSKHPKKSAEVEEESDIDEEDEFDELIGDKSTKVVKTTVNSLRADLLLRAGLGIARNKIEVAFYENKIRLNGKKLQKKSINCKVGDEIDLVKGESTTNTHHLVVGRIEILSAVPKDDSVSVTLKRYKSLLIEKYDDL